LRLPRQQEVIHGQPLNRLQLVVAQPKQRVLAGGIARQQNDHRGAPVLFERLQQLCWHRNSRLDGSVEQRGDIAVLVAEAVSFAQGGRFPKSLDQRLF
jgi:hypothetical protein